MLKILKQIEKSVFTDFPQVQTIKAALASGLILCGLVPHPSLALIPDNFEKETELNHNVTPSPLPLQAQEILQELKEHNIYQIALDSTHKCILFNKDTGETEECSEKEMIAIVNSLTGEAQVAGWGDWWNDTLSSFRKSPLCVTVSETIGVGSAAVMGLSIANTVKTSLATGVAVTMHVVGVGTLLMIIIVPSAAVAVTMGTIFILCDEQEINFPDWLNYIWYLG